MQKMKVWATRLKLFRGFMTDICIQITRVASRETRFSSRERVVTYFWAVLYTPLAFHDHAQNNLNSYPTPVKLIE